MLPFIKDHKKSVAGLIIKNRTPDESPEQVEQEESADSIDSCSKALISAVQAGDIKAVSAALKDAFTILDSQPHEEGPHTYEAQNQAAAKKEY